MNMDWNQFLSALLGGILTLSGSIITTRLSIKHTNREWIKNKKHSFYKELIQELLAVKFPCLATEEALSNREIILDVEEINLKLETLGEFIENYRADIYIFAPKGIYTDLIKLQSEIYAIISDKEYQRFNIEDIKKSKIFDVIRHAESIAKFLKSDLLND